MKILLVEPRLSENGAIRVSLDRAHRWHRQGAEVTVLLVEDDRARRNVAQVPAGLQLVFSSLYSSGKQFANPNLRRIMLGANKRLRIPTAVVHGLKLSRRADVVVGGREIDLGLIVGSRIARLSRRPFAVTIQSNIEAALKYHVQPHMKSPTLRALRSAGLAVCVAEGAIPSLTALGVPQERIKVVYNGIDVQGLREQAERAPTLALPDGPLVVAAGRLDKQKGFDVLLRAHAKALGDGAPPHAVLIMGEGPERRELEQLAISLGVAGSVQMPGFVDNPYPIIAHADLFTLPSRWEGLPLTLIEALCLGTPVIATDCVAGPSELLRDGAYGQLVPVEDVEALSASIVAHLRDPEELRSRARAGAVGAAERFDPERAAQRHLELLEDHVKAYSQ